VRKPVGERFQAQIIYFLKVIGRVGELAEDLGIVEVAGAILGRDILEGPDGNQVKQDQAGDQPIQQSKASEPGKADFDGVNPRSGVSGNCTRRHAGGKFKKFHFFIFKNLRFLNIKK
jgi:hypothetical protein